MRSPAAERVSGEIWATFSTVLISSAFRPVAFRIRVLEAPASCAANRAAASSVTVKFFR